MRVCVHLFARAYAFVRMRESERQIEIAQMQWINTEQVSFFFFFFIHSNKTQRERKKKRKTDFALFV